jgi:putative polyhydroxyalkanoate system protein
MTIQRSFSIPLPAAAMRQAFEDKALTRTDMKMFFGDVAWSGDTMNFKSGLGEGTIAFTENKIDVNIELTMFGKAMQGQVESAIDQFPALFK